MDKNNVVFKIYINNGNNEHVFDKDYTFNLNDKIIDIKNKILKDSFKNNYNYLEMDNITDKVYKDYGKLFFDKGLLPITINNYKLCEFTNSNRVFSFLVKASNLNIKEEELDQKIKKIKYKNDSFIKKMIKENNKNNGGYVYDEDDFPPLPSIK
jgi:hypothetical protein